MGIAVRCELDTAALGACRHARPTAAADTADSPVAVMTSLCKSTSAFADCKLRCAMAAYVGLSVVAIWGTGTTSTFQPLLRLME
jgi:hypothetical protein